VTIKCLPPEDPVLGLRWSKRFEQHGQDKHPRGPSTPRHQSSVSHDRSVTRSAQDDDFVGVLTKNIQNKLALMGHSPGLAGTTEKSRRATEKSSRPGPGFVSKRNPRVPKVTPLMFCISARLSRAVEAQQRSGFSPCAFFPCFRRDENTRALLRLVS
jgi:hypothetical protein